MCLVLGFVVCFAIDFLVCEVVRVLGGVVPFELFLDPASFEVSANKALALNVLPVLSHAFI